MLSIVAMTVRILLAGGTGLIGGLVTVRLLGRGDVRLDSLVRTPRRPEERRVDFDALTSDRASTGGEAVDVGISCLGTTLRRAGSRDAFRRVDHDYVLAVARAAAARGARRFVLVSSVGAGGGSFYLRVKGETEMGVGAVGFERLDILRPSLLLGARAERRSAERLAQIVAPLLNPLLRGSLARYAALEAGVVAAAIERLAFAEAPGTFIHHTDELRALAKEAR